MMEDHEDGSSVENHGTIRSRTIKMMVTQRMMALRRRNYKSSLCMYR